MLIATTDETLKVKLQQQKNAAEAANVSVQKKVANAKSAENNAKRFKEEVEGELQNVKKAKNVNDASNAQTKAITAANNAHDEITKAQTALNNAKKEFESSEKAKHRAKALVSAFKTNTEYEKAKQHHEETKQKKSEINEQSDKISELLKDSSENLKKKTESHKTLADQAVSNSVTQVTNAGNAEKEALKIKEQADNAVNSALEETTTLDYISKASNTAETESTNAKKQTEKANNALKEVAKIWTTASLSRYRIAAIVGVSKAEETIQKMEQKVNEAKEQNLKAENAVNAIQKLKDSISTEMQTKIDPILQKAQAALQSIIAGSTKMEQNMEKAKEKKGEAEAAMNAIIGKDDVTVDIAQNKSVEAETAAIAAESELLKANNAFSSVFAETEKAKKAQYEANIIITFAKINESFESTKKDHVSVVEKKGLIDTYVNEMNALQTDTPKNVVSELTRLIGEAQKSQTTADDEVKKANTAEISAKEEHDKWSNTLEEIKNVQKKEKMQLLFDQINVSFLVVQNAASNANRALKATETAELNALRANLHAVALVADAKATLYVKNAKKDFDMLSEIKVKITAHKNEMLSIMQNAPTTLHEELRGKQEIVHNAQNEFNTEVIHAQKAVTNTEKYKNIAASALANVMSKETPLNNAKTLAQQGKEAAVNALKEAEIVKNVLLSAQNAEKRSSNATREAKQIVEKLKESTKQPNVSTTTHTPLNTETKETDKEETLAISTEVDAKDKDTDSKTDESRKEENEKTEKKNVEESSSDDKIIKEEKQASKTVDNTSLLENHDADFMKKKTSESTAFTNLVNERTLQAMLFLMLIIFQL